jgi:integrase
MSAGGPPDWRRAVAALDEAYAPQSLDKVRRHFEAFETWCRARSVSALPAQESTVAAHLADGGEPLTYQTGRLRRWVIGFVHREFGFPNPAVGPTVHAAVRQGLRRRGALTWQARPLTFETKKRLQGAAGPNLLGVRNRLMIGLAYDTLCRPTELMSLRIEDLTPQGDGTARVLVRWAKNDPRGRGDVAFISRATAQDMRVWLGAAKLVHGTILRKVAGEVALDAPISRHMLGCTLQTLARRAGVEDAARFSGNSPRVGAAQDLAAAGCSLLEIMRAGRWRDPAIVARYARRAPVNVWAVVEPTGLPEGPLRRLPIVRPPNRAAAELGLEFLY